MHFITTLQCCGTTTPCFFWESIKIFAIQSNVRRMKRRLFIYVSNFQLSVKRGFATAGVSDGEKVKYVKEKNYTAQMTLTVFKRKKFTLSLNLFEHQLHLKSLNLFDHQLNLNLNFCVICANSYILEITLPITGTEF